MKTLFRIMLTVLILLSISSCGGGGSSSDTSVTDTGTTNTGTTNTYYKDADGDKYSDGTMEEAVTASVGHYLASALTATSGDCDDTDPAINPGATEIWGDGIDQDCDGASELDLDGDGIYDGLDACPYDPSADCSLYGPLVAGEECSISRQCGSNVCADDGTGTLRCQELSGCQPISELCQLDTDCCSGSCTLFPGTALGRCINTPGCQENGELCGDGYSINCCSGASNACGSVVDPDIGRCFTDAFANLLPTDDACAFDEECFSGVCVDAGGGVRTCQ